ncbi:MAG: methylmalonate-semialdehyde dehydrogenase (CoA acylating), partial [Proteobacteria bacterium]|nr:methylmalonate-semialdehyde dehydrogenase (CoA acylating) [Pseudomonadota bacterium]
MIEGNTATRKSEAQSKSGEVLGHLVNGAVVSFNEPTLDVFNPAQGTVIRQLEVGRKSAVEAVISAAEKALPDWRKTPAIRRARIMFKFKELLEKNSGKVCELIGQEHGKIVHDAKGELQRGIENVEFACGAPELLKGEYSKEIGTSIDCWSEFPPVGIVAGITPFNFPVMIPLWMYPLAIVCGNCFVLKPSEKDPTSTMFIAELLYEAGLPEGVLNIV